MSALARATAFVAITGIAIAIAMPAAIALPPPRESRAKPTGSPVPAPTGAVYPVGTPLLFVVDETVNSGKIEAGQAIPIHLRNALVVNGATIAPAKTPGSLTVVAVQRASAPDTDGAVEIRVEPLLLPSGKILPLRAVHEYLTPELTGGQLSTRGTMDQVEDVFVPYLAIYQAFRKGHQLLIPRDSVLRVQTAAVIDAQNPNAVSIATPAPMSLSGDVPHTDFTPIPLATPYTLHPNTRATVRPRPSATPTGGTSSAPLPSATTATPPSGPAATAPAPSGPTVPPISPATSH